MLPRLPLHTRRWTVRAVGDLSHVPVEIRDRVRRGVNANFLPGVGTCVHTDLLDAGLIEDPAVGVHEDLVQWVSLTDWCYETEFEPHAFDLGLHFESLDTVAEVRVNGHLIGTAANEFLPWHFMIPASLIEPGVNILQVLFTSPLRHIEAERARIGGLPHNGDEQGWPPFNLVRKCASNFCWDWGPKVATCGITGDVWLGTQLPRLFDSASVRANRESSGSFRVQIDLAFDPARHGAHAAGPVFAVLIDGREIPPSWLVSETMTGGDRCRIDFRMPPESASAFKPNPSFHLLVERRGYRDVPILSTRFFLPNVTVDEHRCFRINSRPVFIKGVNWIPEGLWPRDRTRAKIRERLVQAKAMGCNLIRVWGGGRYESDAFYEICDELGLMVWQDFMFACACYPEEPPFPALIEAEARYQVARLSKHPCVVLWCGGNENHWAYESWGFKARVAPGRGWGTKYWQDLLPKIVAELSPHTPYVPDSPWSPPPTHPNDATVGDRHTWDLFGEDFRSHVPRFCSEFGVQSPSNLETLLEAGILPPADGAPVPTKEAPVRTEGAPVPTKEAPVATNEAPVATNEAPPPLWKGWGNLVARQRGPGGMARWYDEFFAKAGVAPPATFDAWHAAAQQLQADWLYLAVVWLRCNAPVCGGAIIWQLNDAWPGFSWSLIDSGGREKLAYFAVRRAFADRLVETVPFEGVAHRVAINDTDEAWEVEEGWTVEPRSVARRTRHEALGPDERRLLLP